MKKYKIKTIKDILRVINSENKENFIQDFGYFLDIYLINKNNFGNNLLDVDFTWIDDKKHNVKVTTNVIII